MLGMAPVRRLTGIILKMETLDPFMSYQPLPFMHERPDPAPSLSCPFSIIAWRWSLNDFIYFVVSNLYLPLPTGDSLKGLYCTYCLFIT